MEIQGFLARAVPAIVVAVALVVMTNVAGQTTAPVYHQDVLPPLVPWDGRSRELVIAMDDPWITPAEATGLRSSPSYDDTVAWLRKLVDSSPQTLLMISIGKSPQGRDIWMVIASKEGASTPEELKRNRRPTLFWQAGIHPGEIDGKDAGMMMLRDMTVRGTKRDLLERANLIFVPIFNVDGHENASKYHRSNQRGPEVTGWRTTSRNLNLNRDYAKLDSPEMRAMVAAMHAWDPDLFFDIHVTDGADVQYDITWTGNGEHGMSPEGNRWIERVLSPRLEKELIAMGHVPGRYLSAIDPVEFRKGVVEMSAEPRFSNGYGDARHIPTVLVENHALKPHDRRVLGTYVLLESLMRALSEQGNELRAATARDRARRVDPVPLDFARADQPAHEIDYLGVEYRVTPSPIAGGLRVEWLGKPATMRIPLYRTDKLAASVKRPKAYWIPAAWSDVIERLKIHGIEMETIDAWREVDVKMYRLNDPKLAGEPFEGRVRVTATPVEEKRREKFAPGSVRVPTDQPLGDLAIALLEPSGPDSFFQWGFFHEVLQRTEYIDAYIMEPMARRMLDADPKLRDEFTKKLAADKEFASSPAKRLDWFHAKTPYFDERWRLYPVGKE
jgi:hypothetical protein